jgi:hypothetical protein
VNFVTYQDENYGQRKFLFAAKYGAQPLVRKLSTIQSRQRKFSNDDGRNRAAYLRASVTALCKGIQVDSMVSGVRAPKLCGRILAREVIRQNSQFSRPERPNGCSCHSVRVNARAISP